jgi:hypothetical protein
MTDGCQTQQLPSVQKEKARSRSVSRPESRIPADVLKSLKVRFLTPGRRVIF